MAFNEQEEAKVKELLEAYENAKRINDLEPANGELSAMRIEVMDSSGETRSMELERAVAEAGNPVAGRWWDKTLATTKAGGWHGSLDALRQLPATLGLGRYLVTDDRQMRKLDPLGSQRFEDGSPAALDGSMGQCMWCWSRGWYFTLWSEGNREYWDITLKPIPGKKSIYIPAGGTSWLGAGVMDRTTQMLCSVISDDERYRGGSGVSRGDANENHPGLDTPQVTMLGMPATAISTTNFGAYARKRGEGWEANWFVAQAAVQILLAVIMGERNMQAAYNPEKDADGLYQGGFGAGVTTMSDADWNKYNGYYPLVPTSVGVDMGDRTGLVEYSIPASANAEDQTVPARTFQVPCFFGLMHAGFGNLWRWVRGLIISLRENETAEVFVARSLYAGYDPNSTEGMIKVAEMPTTAGYIKRISMEGLCCIPTEVGGSSVTYFADWLYRNPPETVGLRVRAAGGSANNGTNAGPFATNTNNTATTANANYSSPLNITLIIYCDSGAGPCHLAKDDTNKAHGCRLIAPGGRR